MASFTDQITGIVNIIQEGLVAMDKPTFALGAGIFVVLHLVWFKVLNKPWAQAAGLPGRRIPPVALAIGAVAAVAGLFHLGLLLVPDVVGYDQSVPKLAIMLLFIGIAHALFTAMNYAYESKGLKLWLLAELPVLLGLVAYAVVQSSLYYSANPKFTPKFTFPETSAILKSIPWGAVALGFVFHQILGAIWYNPKVFGTVWAREMGIVPNAPGNNSFAKAMTLASIFAALAFLLLAVYFFFTVHGWIGAFLIGAPVALFHVTIVAMHTAFEGRSLKSFLIKAIYPAISIVVFALLYGMMRG